MVQAVENAFNKLEKNEKSKLDATEKKALQDLNVTDIQNSKNWLKSQKFTLDGVTFTLDQAVKNYNTADKSIYLNGNKISVPSGSDLAASMQLYMIANGISVSTNKILGADAAKGIDGILGQASNAAINSFKASGVERSETPAERFSLKELTIKSFKKYVTAHNLSVFQSHGIMDNAYTLTPINKSSYINEKKLKFEYKYRGKTMSISVPIHEDSNGEVDPQKLVNDLANACVAKEGNRDTEITNESAEAGINRFNENNITDPLIKKWAKMKRIDFECTTYDNGRIMVTDISNKNLGGDRKNGGFMLKNTDVLTNGSFDAVKFNNILNKQCYNVALAAVKQYVKDGNKATPGALKYKSEIDRELKNCDGLLREIDKWGHKSDLAPVRKEVSDKKEAIKNQDAYLSEKGKLEDALDKIDDLAGRNNKDFVDNFDKIMAEMKKVAVINKVGGARYTYNVDYATTGRVKFNAVGKKAEYTRMVDNMVNKWRSIRYGGDPMYTVNVVGR